MDKNPSPTPSKKRRISESLELRETPPSLTEKTSISSPSTTTTTRTTCSFEEFVVTDNSPRSEVQQHVPRQEQQQQQQQQRPPLDTPRLYIGGLHPRVTQTHVEKLMMPYGTVQDVRLVVKQHQQQQPGSYSHNNNQHHANPNTTNFAFCQYASIAQAQAAMKALNGRSLLGKRLLVRPANNQQQQQSSFSRRYETHRDQQQQLNQQKSSSGGEGGISSSAANILSSSDTRQEKQEIKKIDSKIEAIKRKLQQP